MVWLTFLLSAVLVVVASIKLAEYGDVIAVQARLGRLFIGTLLMAGATSLPELLSAISAISINAPNLAGGSMFGSGMFNMFMLGLLDLLHPRERVLRRVAVTHSLTASLGTLLTSLAMLFILAEVDIKIGWVGIDSLLIMGAYLVGVRLLQQKAGVSIQPKDVKSETHAPTLVRAAAGFALATFVLLLVTPTMVSSADQIAALTGLGTGFIGATLIAVTTSLPELVATVAAARLGAYDLAVGNLFGSNIFNMFALGLTDFFYTPGRFLDVLDPSFAIVGLLVIILTNLGLVGNLAQMERRFFFVEFDALLIMIGYFLGMYLLYLMRIGV